MSENSHSNFRTSCTEFSDITRKAECRSHIEVKKMTRARPSASTRISGHCTRFSGHRTRISGHQRASFSSLVCGARKRRSVTLGLAREFPDIALEFPDIARNFQTSSVLHIKVKKMTRARPSASTRISGHQHGIFRHHAKSRVLPHKFPYVWKIHSAFCVHQGFLPGHKVIKIKSLSIS